MWLLLLSLVLPTYGAQCRHSSTRLSCVEFVENYDGDTITFTIPRVYPLFGDHVRIRVKGIDAPEIASTKSCERDLAEKVKQKVHNLLVKAKRIDLVKPKRDKYFRILADVEFDGISLTEYLLKRKWAISYNGEAKPNHDWCKKSTSFEESSPLGFDFGTRDLTLPHEPYQGEYEFSGKFEPSLHAHNVRLYLNNDEARERMKKYMREGYICENALGHHVLCRRLVDLTEIPDVALKMMRKKLAGLTVQFAPYEGSGTMITEGETYHEWQVPARVTIRNEVYESYIFSKTQSGLVKVTMGYDSNEKDRYSFVVDQDQLKYYVRAVIEKNWEWSEYSAFAIFQPTPTK